jgi:amino acid transporter
MFHLRADQLGDHGRDRPQHRHRGDGRLVNLPFSLAGERLGAGLADAGSILLITSAFAAMLSFHNTCARYSYALAREGVLPRGLAQTGARSGAPQASSALQRTLSLIVIIVYAIGGCDPINQLFFWGGALGGFGVLACLIATSLAVMAYFARRSHDESPFTWLIAPLLSAAALGVVFWRSRAHNRRGRRRQPAALISPESRRPGHRHYVAALL